MSKRNTTAQKRRYASEFRARQAAAGLQEVRAWFPADLVEKVDAFSADTDCSRGEAIESLVSAGLFDTGRFREGENG